MIVNKKLVNKWKLLREKNDVAELALLTKKNRSTISRIVNGKQATTPFVLAQINDFFKERKKTISKIENDLD